MQGFELVEDALASGKGVLVVTAHVTSLEVGAAVLGLTTKERAKGVYRPLSNAVMEWYQNRGRASYAGGMIPKRDMRSAVRHLRKGGLLWYAPDQDFGPEQSVFAPFFGIQTATLLATQRLPKMTGCQVLTMMPRYCHKARAYVVEVAGPLQDYPGEDPDADLARINALLEEQIRKAPEQYWWVHRRFKTRPPGEEDFYGRDSRHRTAKVDTDQ